MWLADHAHDSLGHNSREIGVSLAVTERNDSEISSNTRVQPKAARNTRTVQAEDSVWQKDEPKQYE